MFDLHDVLKKIGGNISGHPLGTWSIPPVIVDEELHRSNYLSSK